ncbi:MAG: DUF1572 domain-containing protein [Methanobacteriota archaeon]|nr:MAG: DUF1572 domain-containing protein [Euryarchaeota archaeon]
MGCEDLFLEKSMTRLQLLKAQGDGVLDQISSDEQVQWMPNKESNSIAMIVKHLRGNMKSRWTNFLTDDGEKPDRNRPSEFFINNQPTLEETRNLWEEGWGYVFSAIGDLKPSDLSRTITIRSEPLLVMDAILRQLLHYSGHIGQMVFLGKMLLDEKWNSLSIPRMPDERYGPES